MPPVDDLGAHLLPRSCGTGGPGPGSCGDQGRGTAATTQTGVTLARVWVTLKV